MRTETQIRARMERFLELLKGPVEVNERLELELRVDELKRVLEQWPYQHAFETWEKTSGKKQTTCALCGRLKDDALHAEPE